MADLEIQRAWTGSRPGPHSAIRCAAGRSVVLSLAILTMLGTSCAPPVPDYDIVLRGGTIYDGSGEAPYTGDLAIRGDAIVALGALGAARGETELDVAGLAVAPGFINMMSWANESLIEDGRSQSDIRQGVTLEVMGEGFSMGPLNQDMTARLVERQADIKYDVEWTTLGGYLDYLVARGISPNVASFVGAANPRAYVVGYDDRPATPGELRRMADLVREAMGEGALGVASSLIYPPGSFASTEELTVLARAAGESGGMYISHLRSEGSGLLEAIDELLTIARDAGTRAEIYHLKASGASNWPLLGRAIEKVEQARAAGLEITADVYSYPAGSTGLNAIMPPWVQEGGFNASLERLRDPELRKRIAREMNEPSEQWENLYLGAGSPENILLVSFKNRELRSLTGKTLAEVAAMRGTSPEDTAMDLILEDESRIGTVYFTQSEDNLRTKIALPWVSLCSDSASLAPEGVFLEHQPHPRAYGSFARFLGKFVREEGLVSLEEAVRKMTSLPAGVLRIERRGRLAEGYYADVVVFDPATIEDRATFEDPHHYAAGVVHVLVNGVPVLRDGEHTGATPGRVVRGPGWKGR